MSIYVRGFVSFLLIQIFVRVLAIQLIGLKCGSVQILFSVNPFTAKCGQRKISTKFPNYSSKILTKKQHHVKLQAESFHLNGHIIGLRPLTEAYRQRIHSCFERNSMFQTAVDHCVFFPLVMCLINKTWLELSRVKLCRNDLKGNKNYFKLAGGSSYRG